MTEYPPVNDALLDRVVDFVSTYPEVHDQSDWVNFDKDDVPEVVLPDGRNVCGTAACVAGWAVIMDNPRVGLRPVYYNEPYLGAYGTAYVHLADDDKDTPADQHREYKVSAMVDFQAEGREALGLTRAEASHLFSASNSLEDVQTIAKEIKNGEYR